MQPHASLAQPGDLVNFGILAVDSAGQVLELDPQYTWLRGIHEKTWNSRALRLERGYLITTEAITHVTANREISVGDGLVWRPAPFQTHARGIERVEMDKAGNFYVQHLESKT